MIEPFLKSQLEPVARRRRLWVLSRQLAVCWMIGAGLAFAFYLMYRSTGWRPAGVLPAILVLTLVGALIVWVRHRRTRPDYRQIARQIEESHPELHALLLTAVEQQPDADTGKFHFLQERLIKEAVVESVRGDWMQTVSTGRLVAGQGAQLAALFLLAAALASLRVSPGQAAAALANPLTVQVTPGDATIERGSGLAVLARFDGSLPAEVTLVIRPDAQPERRVPLSKSLNDPVFGGTLSEITNTLSYHVAYTGGRSREFKVGVFDYPRLERADAHLVYPAYTGLPDKRIEDTRRISAVTGTKLDLSLQLNKPVASAKLVAKDKTAVPLAALTNRANAALNAFALEVSQIYEVLLVDADGRTNKVPAQVIVEVLTNRVPELKFLSPRGDQRVSPLEEITFQAETSDDFGLKNYGITYSLAGKKAETLSLGNASAPHEKRHFGHLLSLESLKVEPDELVSYYIWADDIGPDGQLRRSASDMFYAEIRPFEEIFREGQSQDEENQSEQQGGGESQELARLSELQKQIINATWKLQRENSAVLTGEEAAPVKRSPTEKYRTDVDVVKQSQEEALKQAGQKKSESQDPSSKALWDTVEKEMEKAADQLAKAGKAPEVLSDALSAEQTAYQALLKLGSREKEVARSRNRGGGGGGGQNQRQLDQLDLTQSENRYESQSQAAARQDPQQREQLQILSRLKELAQRQDDLNKQLKELQTALQEAKTEEERDEIQRRLKRLREEEQRMLADTDELLQRMQRPENESRMADARQQLEQTRNQVQRASEAIENEQVGQALSAGTRAQRELQELRDDFRKRNAAEFAEEMRQMRSNARELAQNEEKIGEELKSMTDSRRKTLSDTGETKELIDQLAGQREKMTNLLNDITRVSQDSEPSEPLLSKQLYDTLRKASQGNPAQALEQTGELLQMSFANEAAQFEQKAREHINEMKEGVERAAESVLGNETEALRLARNELEDLAHQVEQELAMANGDRQQNAEGQPPNGQRQGQQGNAPGERRNQARQDGQNTPGQDNPELAQAQQQGQGQGQSPGTESQSQEGHQQAQAGGQQNSPQDRARSEQRGQQRGQGGRGQGQGQQQQRELAQAEPNSDNEGSGEGLGQGSEPQGGQGRGQGQRQRPRQRPSLADQPRESERSGALTDARGNANRGGAGGDGGEVFEGPITGEGYADWTDRLRNVEELLDFPELRGELAGIRERARSVRADYKKLSKPPQWDLVRARIAEPLVDIRNRINEELARRESKDSLVPIDRDPVPQRYSELVRRYYQNLGSGEQRPNSGAN